MKWFAISFMVFMLTIVAGSVISDYVNKDKPYILEQRTIFEEACTKRGGNPKTSEGWKNSLYVKEYKCYKDTENKETI